jgi:hypothetical protein
LPPLSSTSSEAAPIEQPERLPLFIRYAENDDDVIAIHRFLIAVAGPRLLAPIDPVKSLMEIIRVTKEEVAIMAMRGDVLVGTLGLIKPTWWYSNDAFLTDRWNFCIEAEKNDNGAGKVMDAEAKAIAKAAGLKFVNQGKIRPAKDGSYLAFPRVFNPEPDIYTPPQGSA